MRAGTVVRLELYPLVNCDSQCVIDPPYLAARVAIRDHVIDDDMKWLHHFDT